MNKKLCAMVGLGAVLASTAAYAGKNECYEINLRTGARSHPVSFIEFVVPPEDSNGDGWFETVVKVRVNDPSIRKSPEAAQFLVTYDGVPTGMSVNIGDSQSNDGFAGDAGNQSNDAELNIGSRIDLGDTTTYEDLFVFGRDGIDAARGTQRIAEVRKIVKQSETIALTLSNERLGYANKHYPISGDIQSTWLYALNGQSDSEGPVNYDIYASFNRVIANNSRIGSGVAKVEICPVSKLDGKDHGEKGHNEDNHH